MSAGVRASRSHALAGTSVTIVLLFGGRWGAYIGVSPLFLSDVLLAAAIVHFGANRLRRQPTDSGQANGGLLFLWLLISWTLVRFVSGWRFDLVAIRDVAPYLYAVAGILGASSMRVASASSRARTARLIVWALGLHALWVSVTLLAPPIAESMPIISPENGLRLFSFRSDVDTAVMGLWTAVLLLALMRRERVAGILIIYIASWGVIFQSQSRAGLLATLVVNLLAYAYGKRHRTFGTNRRRMISAAIPILLAASIFALPQTTIFQRLAGTFGLANTSAGLSGSGTANARTDAWKALYNYTGETPSRQSFGVGFGADPLRESGATSLLVGSTVAAEDSAPRSPHNYWLGSYARLGILGLGILIALSAQAVMCIRRQVTRPALDDQLGLLAALMVALYFPIATLGVVLESPFGAIPFFWALGVLIAYSRSSPDQTPGDIPAARPLQGAGQAAMSARAVEPSSLSAARPTEI
jgi:hypothetical protein